MSGLASVQPAANGPKFGKSGVADRFINAGISLTEKVVPVSLFEKITEVFLVGFIAQDVFAMWLPRVATSLRVGRQPYDPEQDPQAKNLSEFEKFKKKVGENYKGLNWVNFYEETKREVATGPGLLAVPAITFILNRYMGNRAREMSYDSLKNLGLGFSEHLADQAITAASPDEYKAKYKKAVQQYIQSLFVDPKLEEEEKVFLQKWSKKWTTALFEQEEQSRGTRWLENIGRFFFSKRDPNNLPPLEKLSTELSNKIREFNRRSEARMEAYEDDLRVIADDTPLHHSEQTWISYQPKSFNKAKDKRNAAEAKALVQHRNTGQLTGDLNRFGAYIKTVLENHQKTEGKAAISEVAKHTMQSLAGSKMILGVGTTVLTAMYLLKLAFWAQNHNSYQAVRMLKHDPSKNNQLQQAQHQHLMGAHAVQAGLPFGAQPAPLYAGISPSPFRAPMASAMPGFTASPFQPGFTQFRAINPQQAGWRQA